MLTPEMLDRIEAETVKAASALERAVISLTGAWALKPAGHELGFLSALQKLVGFGMDRVRKRVVSALFKAENIGTSTADADLDWLRRTAPKMPRTIATGVTIRTPAALAQAMHDMTPHIVMSATGLYREILQRTLSTPPESEAARRRIAQDTLDDFTRRGITGFVDKGGRRWNMVSYIEMATRTAATQAATDAHLHLLAANGLDVVRMTVVPNCSNLCAPFQGRLLSISGATRGEFGGHPIVASVSEAIARGYQHPGCRHTLQMWVPGDVMPTPPPPDPEGYRNTQTLRRLEREVRQAKRAEAAAVTEESRAVARRAVRHGQARIRAHIDSTGLVRKREREQIGRVL